MKNPAVFLLSMIWLMPLTGWGELLFPNSDFESGTLENWTASGNAFTRQPTRGDNTSARGNVSCGLQGDYWIGTYENYDGVQGAPGDVRGDGPTGTLTSQEFVLQKPYITFRVGGGNHPGLTGVKLLCEGEEYPMSSGFNSEAMMPVSFDVSSLAGKTARIVVFDQASGGWGHINADCFEASDEPVAEEFRLTPGIPLGASPAAGYQQAQRPQFHFTSRRNWLNDPNGMVFDGEKYHLFFQHNPLGTGWGNMTWGHAVSTDMIHWRQQPHALLPYQLGARSGTIYSGTAVVDHRNDLGVQVSSRKTIAAFYTYAHQLPFYQGLAYSTDGGVTWKYHDEGRAVVPNQGFDSGERDPKVFWHEASQKWVMALWVQSHPGRVRFFTSSNLKDWTFASDLMRDWAFECMDVVFLPVDGDPGRMKCVIYDASFDYEIGSFDGTSFHTESGPFRAGHGNFYAAQTFNQAPGGRVVQIGWMSGGPNPAAAYGMPFNQQMSFPCDLSLRTTPAGVRLCAYPIGEISGLVQSTRQIENQALTSANPMEGWDEPDLVDLTLEFDPGSASEIVLELPRTTVRYQTASGIFTLTGTDGNPATLFDGPVEPRSGRVKLRLLLDRLSLEAYAFDGEKFGSHYVHPEGGSSLPAIRAVGGEGWMHSLSVRSLRSAWEEEVPLSTTLLNPGFDENLAGEGGLKTEVPGWKAYAGENGSTGVWDDEGDALPAAEGFPDFSGRGAASLAAGAGASGQECGLYQSLGYVALADVGKTFVLEADLGARIFDGPGNYSYEGELSVSFRKGVSEGAPGDGGTLVGEAGIRSVAANDVDLPSLENVAWSRKRAVFTPTLDDVGVEIFAVMGLKQLSASESAAAGEKYYLVDQVTLSVEAPSARSGPLAYEGFDYPAGGASLSGKDGGFGWSGPWLTVDHGSADLTEGSLVAGERAPEEFDLRSVGNRCLLPNGRRVGRYLDTSLNGPFGERGLVNADGRIGKDGTTLYLSFLQQPSGTSLFYEFELHRGGLGDSGRIAGIGNDRPGNDVYLRAPNPTHTRIGAGDASVNFYVVRIDFKEGHDDVHVYRNPVSRTEPAVATLTRLNAADLSFDGISFGAFVNGRTVMHDEIRCGTSWAEVIVEHPYDTWAWESGLDGVADRDPDFEADPDRDSMPNGLEWVLGGDPLSFDVSPVTGERSGNDWLLTFPRREEPADQVDLVLQWSADLEGSWISVPVQAGGGTYANGVVVTVDGGQATVRIPMDASPGGKLFTRLRAAVR